MPHISVVEDEVLMDVLLYLNELDEETGGPIALGKGAMRLIRTPDGFRQEILIGENKIMIVKLREVQMETHEVQTENGEEKIETRNYLWATFNPDHLSEEGLTGRIRENGLLLHKESIPYHITKGMGGPYIHNEKTFVYTYILHTGPSMMGPIVPFEPGTLINMQRPIFSIMANSGKTVAYPTLEEGKWQEIPTLIRDYMPTVITRLAQDVIERKFRERLSADEKIGPYLGPNRDYRGAKQLAQRSRTKARCLPPGPGPCPPPCPK